MVFDHTARSGQETILIDDSTGRAGGMPLSDGLLARLAKAGLPVQAADPGRQRTGRRRRPRRERSAANVDQQAYFAAVAARAVLPLFKARKAPFVLVFWSRDPDGTQHNQGDSLGRLVPGINGPTSLAAIRNAEANLAALLAALAEQGLADDDRRGPDVGSRLLHHLEGERDERFGDPGLQGRPEPASCRRASWPSTSRTSSA